RRCAVAEIGERCRPLESGGAVRRALTVRPVAARAPCLIDLRAARQRTGSRLSPDAWGRYRQNEKSVNAGCEAQAECKSHGPAKAGRHARDTVRLKPDATRERRSG